MRKRKSFKFLMLCNKKMQIEYLWHAPGFSSVHLNVCPWGKAVNHCAWPPAYRGGDWRDIGPKTLAYVPITHMCRMSTARGRGGVDCNFANGSSGGGGVLPSHIFSYPPNPGTCPKNAHAPHVLGGGVTVWNFICHLVNCGSFSLLQQT